MVYAAPDLSPRYVLDFSSLPEFGPLPLVDATVLPEKPAGGSTRGVMLLSLPVVVGLIAVGLVWSLLSESAVSRNTGEARVGTVDQAAFALRPTLR